MDPAAVAAALTRVVLLQPGGPNSRIPLQKDATGTCHGRKGRGRNKQFTAYTLVLVVSIYPVPLHHPHRIATINKQAGTFKLSEPSAHNRSRHKALDNVTRVCNVHFNARLEAH